MPEMDSGGPRRTLDPPPIQIFFCMHVIVLLQQQVTMQPLQTFQTIWCSLLDKFPIKELPVYAMQLLSVYS